MNNRNRFFLVGLLALVLSACGGETPNADQPELSETDKALLDNITMSAPVTIEPQAVFDQSQLNDNALGLCLKFKNLEGGDRKETFEKLEVLLPNCPTTMGENNETTPNFDESTQRMRYEDLKELLGEPNEVDTDGTVGYYLTADESYKVVFLPDDQGNIACRYYEGNS